MDSIFASLWHCTRQKLHKNEGKITNPFFFATQHFPGVQKKVQVTTGSKNVRGSHLFVIFKLYLSKTAEQWKKDKESFSFVTKPFPWVSASLSNKIVDKRYPRVIYTMYSSKTAHKWSKNKEFSLLYNSTIFWSFSSYYKQQTSKKCTKCYISSISVSFSCCAYQKLHRKGNRWNNSFILSHLVLFLSCSKFNQCKKMVHESCLCVISTLYLSKMQEKVTYLLFVVS